MTKDGLRRKTQPRICREPTLAVADAEVCGAVLSLNFFLTPLSQLCPPVADAHQLGRNDLRLTFNDMPGFLNIPACIAMSARGSFLVGMTQLWRYFIRPSRISQQKVGALLPGPLQPFLQVPARKLFQFRDFRPKILQQFLPERG
jgi:hypothetical protein